MNFLRGSAKKGPPPVSRVGLKQSLFVASVAREWLLMRLMYVFVVPPFCRLGSHESVGRSDDHYEQFSVRRSRCE